MIYFSTDMIFIDAAHRSLVGVGQMRDLAASVHLKLTRTCLIVKVTLSNPQSDPRMGCRITECPVCFGMSSGGTSCVARGDS